MKEHGAHRNCAARWLVGSDENTVFVQICEISASCMQEKHV